MRSRIPALRGVLVLVLVVTGCVAASCDSARRPPAPQGGARASVDTLRCDDPGAQDGSAPTRRIAYVLFVTLGSNCAELGRTTDGGKTFRRTGLPALQHPPSAIAFSSADHGYLAADEIYATRDGGRHWQAILEGRPIALAASSTWAATVLVTCRRERCNAEIRARRGVRTHWSSIATRSPREPAGAAAVAEHGVGIVAIAGRLWRTVNFGRSWSRVPAPCPGGTGQHLEGPLLAMTPDGVSWAMCGAVPGAGLQTKYVYRFRPGRGAWVLTSGRRGCLSCELSGGYLGDFAAIGGNVLVSTRRREPPILSRRTPVMAKVRRGG
jgi:hypothetical protein